MAVAGIKAGAEDFIEKPVNDTQLVAAINRGVARTFTELLQQHSLDQLSSQFRRLTPREVEIFDMVVQGDTSQAIAAKLGIGTRTVESHRSQVLEKMEADSVSRLSAASCSLGPHHSVGLPPYKFHPNNANTDALSQAIFCFKSVRRRGTR